jgi:hypothetical protein
MHRLLLKLWNDDRGSLQVTEWLFLATILILGVIPGIVAVRNSLNSVLVRAAFAAAAGVSGVSACSVGYVPAASPSSATSSVCD